MDMAVFCLALMGTDYPGFLREAHRVLRVGGFLWIAEVSSRFQSDHALAVPASKKRSTTAQRFLRALEDSGFKLRMSDEANRMFVIWELGKATGNRSFAEAQSWPNLRACSYKKR